MPSIYLLQQAAFVITILVIFMVIDFVTGMVAASVFKVSKHEECGLSSKTCWKGLYKKAMALLFCFMSALFDLLLGTKFILYTVAIGFIVSESISIMENAGLMGVPVPRAFKEAIAILKNREEK